VATASTAVVESEPVRRCVVSGRRLDKRQLIRFVAAPDGAAVPDIEMTLPGRGLWVGAERALVERAVAKGRLSHLGRPAADMADRIEVLLARRCRELLGLAKRAGLAVAGMEKVRTCLVAGEARVIAEARDGAEDGAAKIARLVASAAPPPELVRVLDRAELGPALGREDAVHVALRHGRLSDLFLDETRRLAGFRSGAAEAGTAKRI
jgi:uncharacterized protein